jgi:tetratricopeptide (TPR) repeat protein
MEDTPRALELCREGMAAVAGALESPDLADLLHETARACFFSGLPGEAVSLCRQVLEMAERTGAVRVQAEALSTWGMLPGQTRQETVSALTRAIELAESAGLLDQAARAHNNLGVQLGDTETAREHFLRAAELARQRGEVLQELFFASNATLQSLWLGDLAAVEEALPLLRQLPAAAQKPGMMTVQLRGLEAGLLRYQGRVTEAIEGTQLNRTEARAKGDLQGLASADLRLAEACIREGVGEEEELEAVLRELVDLCDRGVGWMPVMGRCLLSVWRARQGQVEAARRVLAKAHELTPGPFGPSYLPWAEANLAMAEGRWPKAFAAFEAAVDTMGRADLRWSRARTLVDWAEAHLARGESRDRERAVKLLREAETEFEAMGAPIYVERVRERQEELGAGSRRPVPGHALPS